MRTSKPEAPIYYVYVYLDTSKPKGEYQYGKYHFKYEPFNVGKGSRLRHRSHLTGCSHNRFFDSKLKKLRNLGVAPKIILKFKNLTEARAFELEERLITTIGRRDLKTGPLTNLSKGGTGGSAKGPATIKKMSRAQKESWSKRTTEEIQLAQQKRLDTVKNKTLVQKELTRRKQSDAHKVDPVWQLGLKLAQWKKRKANPKNIERMKETRKRAAISSKRAWAKRKSIKLNDLRLALNKSFENRGIQKRFELCI